VGYRTVVVLYNDQASTWEKDELLGQKIARGMNDAMGMGGPERFSNADLGYGKVVQCTHADTHTLALIESYNLIPIAHGFWHHGQDHSEMCVQLMKDWADKHGYRLVKKSKETK